MKFNNTITDVPGIEVGQAQDDEALTGCTVILCRKGAVAGVDVRGGAPGTRETDLLDPVNLVEKVHAVVLAGGSAFGLDAASGVMRYLEENDIGFNTGVAKVPIVPAAILFDLNVGRPDVRPDAEMGYRAASACFNGSASRRKLRRRDRRVGRQDFGREDGDESRDRHGQHEGRRADRGGNRGGQCLWGRGRSTQRRDHCRSAFDQSWSLKIGSGRLFCAIRWK